MFEFLKKYKKNFALMLSASLVAGSIFSHPISIQAEENEDFQLNASWVNSPSIDENGYASQTDYIWNATTEETKSVSMAVEYYFNNSVNSSGFPSGSIEIYIPGLRDTYRENPKEAEISLPDSNWDYTYNESTDEYIVTNTSDIDNLTGFAGEFILSYEMNSRELISGTAQMIEPVAVVQEDLIAANESLYFNFISEPDLYQITASVKTIGETSDYFDRDDLNIVRYEVTEVINNASRGTYGKYYTISGLDDGVVLGYSDEENIVTSVEEIDLDEYMIPYAPTRQIYVGYPLDKTDYAEHDFVLYGYYYDVDILENLAITDTTLNLDDFSFTYDGELYMIGKTGYDTKPAESRIPFQKLTDGYTATYSLSAVARYTNPGGVSASGYSNRNEYQLATPYNATYSVATPYNAIMAADYDDEEYIGDGVILNVDEAGMDVWIIDDFIYILDENGVFQLLDADEYDMKSITIPDHTCFTNEDGLAFASGKYTAEILVNTFDRNAAPYKSVKIGETEQVIELPDDTNRIMVRICGLEESMYLEHGNMWLDIEYHLDESKSYLTGGYLRNLDSIWVDWCGTEHHNEVDPLVSYPGDDDDVIKNRDMDSYGVYMQRNYFDYYYTDRNIQGLLLASQVTDDSYDSSIRSDGFIITDQGYESFVNFTSVFTNVYDGSKGWSVYTVLPKGMEVNHNEAIAFDIQLPNDLSVSKNNLKVKEIDNYKGSGRTYVEIYYDLKDQTALPSNGIIMASVEIPVVISYKAASKNTAYPVWGVSMMTKPESDVTPTSILESAYPGEAMGGTDNGSAIAMAGTEESDLWNDIDRDGDTDETFVYNNVMLTVKDLAAVNMEVISYVKGDNEEFLANIDADHNMTEVKTTFSGSYVYRLNAVNTGAMASNVVFYDILEEATLDGNSGAWKGIFDRVDTSVLEAYDLEPVVYYSTEAAPVLDYTSTSWTETIPTDKSTITAVAVVADQTDKEFVVTDNVFVDIHMTAPSDNPDDMDIHNTHTLNSYTLIYDTASATKTLDSNITGVTMIGSAKLTVTKQDSDTKTPLSGAEFKLVSAEDETVVIETFETNENGQYTVTNIPYGEYILYETMAPDDHKINEDGKYIIYAGNNETKTALDGKEHEFVRNIELTVYNDLATDRSLTITKTITDPDEIEIFGTVSFLYHIGGYDKNGNYHSWKVIITPENGFGSVTLENIPVSDENGYKVIELNSDRYALREIGGTNLIGNPSLAEKAAVVDLLHNKTAQADYTNEITRWNKFSWSSSAINHISK